MNPLRVLFPLLAFMFLIQACGVPGLTPAPIPTMDADTLARVIAGTAAAAATQTALAAPSMPALSDTATSIPTPALPVSTPEIAFSAEGTALIPDEGGSVLFVDQTLGYRLRVPAGWLLVRVDEPEMAEAFTLPAAADPRVRNFLEQVQKNDPKTFRLFGADPDPAHMEAGFVSNFNVFWDAASTGSLDDMLSVLEQELPHTSLTPVITHSEVTFTSSRVPVGIVESTATLFSSEGWPVYLYQKQVLFLLPTGTLTVVLSTSDDQKNGHLPAFDLMIDQFTLLGQ